MSQMLDLSTNAKSVGQSQGLDLYIGKLSGPLLIFGGPYSNLGAVQAMRIKAEELDIPACNIICTGDVVAYCAQPQECVDLIREWGVHVVQGNCESALADDREDCGCGFEENTACDLASKEWFAFARQHVSMDAKAWMAKLPFRIRFEHEGLRYCVIHGGLEQQNEFIFESTATSIKLAQLKAAQADVVIGGHCGLPFGQRLGSGKFWLNAGVIGMPANDGQTQTWYMTIGQMAHKAGTSVPKLAPPAEWHTLLYDYRSTINAMHDANLCRGYAKALETGYWPALDILPEPERVANLHHSLSEFEKRCAD